MHTNSCHLASTSSLARTLDTLRTRLIIQRFPPTWERSVELAKMSAESSRNVGKAVEYLDVLTSSGKPTGVKKDRKEVHAEGLYHRAVHTWLYAESTKQFLVQKRADEKDSWAGLWDISSAGHISAGDSSLSSARRELEEELGVALPATAFELIFEYLQRTVINGGSFKNNEFDDVYLVTLTEPIPIEAFVLQKSEVAEVKWVPYKELELAITKGHPEFVPFDDPDKYIKLITLIKERYEGSVSERAAKIKSQVDRYVPVKLSADLSHLSKGDAAALVPLVKAGAILDDIFKTQVWQTNAGLGRYLKKKAEGGGWGGEEVDVVKAEYYNINKGPWSVLDENAPFLTTADSQPIPCPKAVKGVRGYKGVVVRAAFPAVQAKGANFYPSDMAREEYESWEEGLPAEKKEEARGFYSVIRRPTPPGSETDLKIVSYSEEYKELLTAASQLLKEGAELADTMSLKRLLQSKAEAFLSDDYYESDIAWMELDSAIDVTIGPYETYEDRLFGYKATFETFIGLRDDEATGKVKLFSDYLQELEDNLPEAEEYKQKVEGGSPIRVIQLIYTSGDVKGPQTVAFNLPNDERIQKERGTAMVMLQNVSQAKFDFILIPIAATVIAQSQREDLSFDAFYTHTLCHECCHGIGPHTITLPGGDTSTVRQELQELYSTLEEAKADIVGLWALHYLLDKGLIPPSFERSMYVSFLAGCFRSVRFGLVEAHGQGQAVQFNWILTHGGFEELEDGSFAVNFSKVRMAVESLSRTILTIQAQGDKAGASALLAQYGVLSAPLESALNKLQSVNVPIDVAPSFAL